jgi:hypothetical protein
MTSGEASPQTEDCKTQDTRLEILGSQQQLPDFKNPAAQFRRFSSYSGRILNWNEYS